MVDTVLEVQDTCATSKIVIMPSESKENKVLQDDEEKEADAVR